MIIGIPVLNRPEITDRCVAQLEASTDLSLSKIVIIDNASDVPYQSKHEVIRNEENLGFYVPINQLADQYPYDTIIAVMHNDLLIYEKDWNSRVIEAFSNDEDLAIVGFCGSYEVDKAGGRGAGTMCNFRGEYQLQEHTGERIIDLQPSAILDSMFMAFRADAIEDLWIEEDVTPAHFYDKILPMRAIELGYHVGTMGIEVDHMGGTTLVAEPRFEEDMQKWCLKHGIDPGDDAGMAVYLEAERRWLTEFGRMMPGVVDGDYAYHRR